MNRRTVLLAAAAGLAAPAILRAQAAYPERPIRLIIPWPPGQATDLAGRVVAQSLSERLGQPVVPENRAGAGGMIGTDAVAKAAPDGHTLLAASLGPITTAPLVQRTPYDAERDFAPVASFGLSPYVLVRGPGFPATSDSHSRGPVPSASDRCRTRNTNRLYAKSSRNAAPVGSPHTDTEGARR